MILSYCLNPSCSQPQNHPNSMECKACGAELILHDRYRAVKKIGKGGFGATFLGIDLKLPGNPFCVIKQLKASTDEDAFQMALDLFEREAKTLGKIDHPQIPRLLDYFEDKKKFYLIQTLVKGKNLRQEVKENGVFSENATKRFLAEILPVLKYVHSLKMIHRDIKPANIIRREQDGQLVLIDFGAVKDQVNTQLASNYGKTAFTQFAVGTMGFAPPEQLAMRPVYSSDIYALGSTCLFLMTGKAPKDLPCDELTGELLWEKEIRVSRNFAQVLSKMLEVDLRHRYRNIDQVINDLDMMPYDVELKENLISNPSKIKQSTDQDDSNVDSNNYTSSTSRLAMAIRARKSRQGKAKPSLPLKITITPESLLSSYAMGRTDFSNESFSNFDLSNANIPNVSLRHCKFIKANLEGANLEGANCYHADFTKARLVKANLKKSHLSKAELQYTDFRNADLQGANFENANIYKANFCGANLTDAKIDEAQLQEAETNWNTIFPDGKKHLW